MVDAAQVALTLMLARERHYIHVSIRVITHSRAKWSKENDSWVN